MRRRPPRSTRTDTPFPYTSRFRSIAGNAAGVQSMAFSVSVRTAGRKCPVGVAAAYLAQTGYAFSHPPGRAGSRRPARSEEHTSELQSLMRTSYAVFCLKKKISRGAQHHMLHIDRKTRRMNTL